jgi:hypothetical protein
MNGDVIRLGIPAKPDYILAVRLAVSGGGGGGGGRGEVQEED